MEDLDILAINKMIGDDFVITKIKTVMENDILTCHVYGYRPIKEIEFTVTINNNGELD